MTCAPSPRDCLVRCAGPHGRVDLGARGNAELDRCAADAAGAAMHEQPLAEPQLALREEHVMGGREDLRYAARRSPVKRGGNRHQLALMDDGKLRLAAAPDDPHHAVAERKPARSIAESSDLPGQLQARNVRRGSGRRRVLTGDLHQVGRVEAGGANPHQHLALARPRVGMLRRGHGAACDRRGNHRTSTATHSMCGVCGNMSTPADALQPPAGLDELRRVRRERRRVAGHVDDPLRCRLDDPADDLLRQPSARRVDDNRDPGARRARAARASRGERRRRRSSHLRSRCAWRSRSRPRPPPRRSRARRRVRRARRG